MHEGGNLAWSDADKRHYARPDSITVAKEIYEFIRDTDTDTLVRIKVLNPGIEVRAPQVQLYI